MILDAIDVLIDGRFVEAEKDARLQWRGSRNQKIWWLRQPPPAEDIAPPGLRFSD